MVLLPATTADCPRQIQPFLHSLADIHNRGSYRDLLATAEAILLVDDQTCAVEKQLSAISHECRPPSEKIEARPLNGVNANLAQLRLLQRCHTTADLSLRSLDLLLCARLIVIARLLLKSTGDDGGLPKRSETLRRNFTALRRRLVQSLERELIDPRSRIPRLLKALSAYCLVTSSSPEDALVHLRHLRLEKIQQRLVNHHSPSQLCKILEYQVSSLEMFKSILGRPLIEAMNNLQKRPILAEPSIQGHEALDLSRLSSLLPEDVRSFVPYFKKSVPSAEALQSELEAWSHEACTAICESLRTCLSGITEMEDVTDLRRKLYTILLPTFFSTPAAQFIREQFAIIISDRIKDLCCVHSKSLEEITTQLVRDDGSFTTPKLLWSANLAKASLDTNGIRLAKEVSKRHEGHNASLIKSAKALRKWSVTSVSMHARLEEVTKIRWRDIVEEPDDEAEEGAAFLIRVLTDTEPKLYTKTLREEQRKILDICHSRIAEAAEAVIRPESATEHAIRLLRSVRLFKTSMQHGESDGNISDYRLRSTISSLHTKIAEDIATKLSRKIQASIASKPQEKQSVLDSMPSTRAFNTLRQLCKILMEIGGTDLLSQPLVERVKESVRLKIFEEKALKEHCIDNDFDEAYLHAALDVEQLPSTPSNKAASEYWARTKLLFGTLA
jgi:conserved oligomeric Golgi complex subunit 1